MNRNRYQLVFNETLGKFVPQPETARRRGKAPGSVTLAGAVLAGVLAAGSQAAFAVLPVASTGGSNPAFVTYGQGSYQTSGNQAVVSQVGNRAIFNWQSFNVSQGSSVTFQQVDSLANKNLVQGASFTALNRIWDANPSLIAGAINQAPGQQANIILVNNNGIAFMNGAQVNLNSFTATSLNIADKYITGNFLGDNLNPQFQQDPSSTPGFVTVLEGAQITAGTQGRVMLIAPTVSNRGTITAPDGQIILAAGTKAYLRSAGTNDNLRGLLVEVDSTSGLNNYTTSNTSVPASVTLDGVTQQTAATQNMLGQASNSGTLSTPRGNITMVGFAVNQSGIAKATTSVVSNGSIYLTAKDTTTNVNGNPDSTRGGQVILGGGSKTEVTIEADDKTTSTDNNSLGGTGLDRLSEVRVLGKNIYMDGTASITVPAGNVSFTATTNPANYNAGNDPLRGLLNVAEANTRVQIASGASIDVSGLSNVAVAADRNIVAVQLRGDELKDSPANRTGPLRGQTVYVDVVRALANANAGKDTLIAKDSLQGYANQLQRTAAERATKAGTVNIQSDGQAIVESGVKVNLSGGSVSYQGGYVPYTMLSANGVLTDVSNALASVRYTGIPTNLTVNYGRWNRTETFGTNAKRYQTGYVEGQSAGTLSMQSIGTAVMQASITGQVTVGAQQLANGAMPIGATLQIGSDLAAAGSKDYKINQAVRIGNGVNTVVSGLAMGVSLDTVESPTAQQTLELDAALVGEGKVANLLVYSNRDVSTSAVLRTPQKGSVQLTGTNVTVGADITAASGTIAANAVANYYLINQNPGQLAQDGVAVHVANGVNLSTAGVWRNDKATVTSGSSLLPIVDGGSISLSANSPMQNGVLDLGAGVQLDASGGAHMLANGTVVAGKGGAISVAADAVQGLANAAKAYGIKQGGNLSVSSTRIKIGGALESAFGTVNLDPLFFNQGGFSNYVLNGYSTLELAANTVLQPRQQNYQLTTAAANAATGTSMGSITSLATLQDQVRGNTNLTLKAQQNSQNTGTLTLAAGSDIEMDKGATVNLTARSAMTVAGTVRAQGGTINLTLDQTGGTGQVAASDNLLHLASSAVLDTSGVAKTVPDASGGLQGSVLNGGTVTLNANTGYVVADAGSVVNVDGAAPVTLNVRNEAGTLGRSVASDAGTITVFGEDGIILQSTLRAHAGAATQRGGNIEVSLSHNLSPNPSTGYDAEARELHVAATQTAGNTVASLQGATTRANLGWDGLQASGADTVRLTSRDAIVLDSGLNAASGKALPLRELTLDAARIQTSGGNVTLAADTVTMGNANSARVGANASAGTSTGTLAVQARKADLLGNLHLSGMALTDVKATEIISLDGVTSTDSSSSVATINSLGDVSLTSPILTTSSYAKVAVNAAGKIVTIASNGTPAYQPYSVAGALTVNAQNINQGGNILMPFGSVDLEATGSVVLQAGSQISVADQTGAVMPFGQTVNGNSWIVNLDPSKSEGQVAVTQLPQKSVVIKGSTVDMQSGSTVNLSGGGDLQSYEFTEGPGGHLDVLANANTYAILPGYKGGFSPSDPQEAFALRSGTAVYLSGVPGLAAGVYTLLPAHYALLPGAYAVRLNTGISVNPGQTYTQQDGSNISAGYLTDTRANAPKDANWQGIQVLSNAQVHDRSELTITNASSFFASASNRPADAGNFSVTTTGAGAASLNLNGSFVSTTGAGGNGMSIDISAPNLALVSGSTAGIDTTLNTVLDVSTLNAMGASSILLGGTRSSTTDSSTGTTTTALNVGASTLTLANDASHALQAPEVILAATDTVTLKSGSAVVSSSTSASTKASSNYTTAGMGALVRVADSDATFVRTGSPGASQGTLVGESGSSVVAAKSVILDATKTNAYQGSTAFRNNGQAVAGSLQIGAPRVNFGSPTGAVTGITYSQAQLDAMSQLASIGFTSYSTFDFYGDVTIGGLNAAGSPTLGSLALHGAGIAGLGSSANTIALNAKSVLLDNPGGVAYTPGSALGSDRLQITANTLTFGAGDKTLSGLSSVNVNAQQVLGQGTGTTTASVPVAMVVQRVSGAKGSNQSFTTSGAMALSAPSTSATLDAVTDLGGTWSMTASAMNVDTLFAMPSGAVNLTANSGNLVLGSHAGIDVAGRTVSFFDQSQATAAGSAKLTSATGNVIVSSGATVNVSAAAGGDAGTLTLSAVSGAVQVASGTLQGSNLADSSGTRGQGAQVSVDTGSLADFSSLNSTLNTGGFSDTRNVRLRNGNLAVAATDTVTAQNVSLSADNGKLDVRGNVVATGNTGGTVGLYASGDVSLYSGAGVNASATGAGKSGGKVEIGSVSGNVALASGSAVNVSAGSQGTGGSLNLRAARNGTDVKVSALDATVTGARTVTVEAVKTYSGIATLNATGTSSGSVLTLDTINTDNTAFAANNAAIAARLQMTGTSNFGVISGVEVRSVANGNLTLSNDWNMVNSRAGGMPGNLTLRSAGNLVLNGSLSDGFSDAKPVAAGTGTPADVSAADSWSYRLVAGADFSAVSPTAVGTTVKNFTLAADKLVRTGTGNIKVTASGNINLTNAGSVIYTAGSLNNDPLDGFVAPPTRQAAYFTQNGGDVSLAASGDINGTASKQLYSEWLYREGELSTTGTGYATSSGAGNPAWWVRFDQFKQGVATLGGGKLSVTAGGTIRNLSASAVTQGRVGVTAGTPVLARTGGGNVLVQSGADILGGQYFADGGNLLVRSGGKIDSGQVDSTSKPVYTVLAASDGMLKASAVGDLNLQAIVNPTLLPQTKGATTTVVQLANIPTSGTDDILRRSVFSTYGADTEVELASLNGNVTYMGTNGSGNAGAMSNVYPLLKTGGVVDGNFASSTYKPTSMVDGGYTQLLNYMPASLSMTAFQGNLSIGKSAGGASVTLAPSASGQLDLLAQGSIAMNTNVTMNDSDPALFASVLNPSATSSGVLLQTAVRAATPLHNQDTTTAHIYADTGNVQGLSYVGSGTGTRLNLPKAVAVEAGQDIVDMSVSITNNPGASLSTIQAGRDVVYTPNPGNRNDQDGIKVAGSGDLDVEAGRNVSLGTSGGIVSVGNLDNANLSSLGSNIHVAAGVGAAGIDYAGSVTRLLAALQSNPGDATLWQARWLTGDNSLGAANASAAVQAVLGLNGPALQTKVRNWIYTALRITGRDYNVSGGTYAGDYTRGYAAMNLLFPGIETRNADGTFANYKGDLNMFASRIKSSSGGSIDFLVPGGNTIVGLANTPAAQLKVDNNVLGIVVGGTGNIQGFARNNVTVNQSRILTVSGGDVLLWSSDGDIDAGKGKKTASAVPPPVISVDSQGNVTQTLQGAATGSGIGALAATGSTAGNVDLIAPKGTVNAGDAGIRAGNLNVAALDFKGADNVTVSGRSTGVPVADTSAVTAAASGATSMGDDASKTIAAASQAASEAARTAQQLASAFKPSVVSVDVLGYGE